MLACRLRLALMCLPRPLLTRPTTSARTSGAPLPAPKRKARFSRAAARAGRTFPTDLVFTFYFYQHVVDAATYHLDVLYRCGVPQALVCHLMLVTAEEQCSKGERRIAPQLVRRRSATFVLLLCSTVGPSPTGLT